MSSELHEAARAVLDLWPRPDESTLCVFERVAADFYRDTGILRPGKSEPMDCGAMDQDEKRQAFMDWQRRRVERLRAALDDDTNPPAT